MRWTFLVAAMLLAGCASAPGPTVTPEGADEAGGAPMLLPDASDLRAFADTDAKAWDPAARLILVAAFEGDLPHWNEPLVPVGEADPWVGPYRGQAGAGELADGRSRLWSFSYTVEDVVSDTAMAICERGAHAEVREAHVVTVDATGQVLASYETRNDDEGSTTTGFLPEGLIGSAEAAMAAEGQLGRLRSTSVFTRTFLMSEWVAPQPAWVFILDGPDERHIVAVDATTGAVLGDVAGPRC